MDPSRSPADAFASFPGAAPALCPRCDYNLTGLPQPRCPECGFEFAWHEVGAVPPRPTIRFEQASGWDRVPAFFVTWVSVLFTPWIFAHQVVRQARVRSALLFAAACFACTPISFVFEPQPELLDLAGWWIIAAMYLPVQTLLLALADVAHWGHFRAALRFWLIVGGYTSAVVVTEAFGSPLVTAGDLWQLVTGQRQRIPLNAEMYTASLSAAIGWSQLALWSCGIGCCYFVRLRRRAWSGAEAYTATALLVLGLIVLHSLALEAAIQITAKWFL
jgi:hypothetical protein